MARDLVPEMERSKRLGIDFAVDFVLAAGKPIMVIY
jgi:hypothetical protein